MCSRSLVRATTLRLRGSSDGQKKKKTKEKKEENTRKKRRYTPGTLKHRQHENLWISRTRIESEYRYVSRTLPIWTWTSYRRPSRAHWTSWSAALFFFFLPLSLSCDALTSILNWMFVAHAKSISHAARIDISMLACIHPIPNTNTNTMQSIELCLPWPKV